MNRRIGQIAVVTLAASALALACAAQNTQPPPPPPPPPAPVGPPTCVAGGVLTYDPAATPPLRVSPKPIEFVWRKQGSARWAVCWTLVVQGDDPEPFQTIRLTGLDALKGQGNQPVLLGDTNFQGRQTVAVHLNDQPAWGSGTSVTITYGIEGRLKGATTDLAFDPDVVIKKPSG